MPRINLFVNSSEKLVILLFVAFFVCSFCCLCASTAYLSVFFRMTFILCLHMLTCSFPPGDAVSFFSRHPSSHSFMPILAITFIMTLLLNSQLGISLSPFCALLLTSLEKFSSYCIIISVHIFFLNRHKST